MNLTPQELMNALQPPEQNLLRFIQASNVSTDPSVVQLTIPANFDLTEDVGSRLFLSDGVRYFRIPFLPDPPF